MYSNDRGRKLNDEIDRVTKSHAIINGIISHSNESLSNYKGSRFLREFHSRRGRVDFENKK